jgi:hypothetical protein
MVQKKDTYLILADQNFVSFSLYSSDESPLTGHMSGHQVPFCTKAPVTGYHKAVANVVMTGCLKCCLRWQDG